MPGTGKFQRLRVEGLCIGGQAGEWRRLEMYILRLRMALKTRGRILKINAVSKQGASGAFEGGREGGKGSGRFSGGKSSRVLD